MQGTECGSCFGRVRSWAQPCQCHVSGMPSYWSESLCVLLCMIRLCAALNFQFSLCEVCCLSCCQPFTKVADSLWQGPAQLYSL